MTLNSIRLAFLGLLFSAYAPLSAAYTITGNETEVSMGKLIEVYEDPTGVVPFEQIRNSENIAWKKVEKENPSFGYSNSVFWFRLKVRWPATKIGQEYRLEIGYPLLDDIWFLEPEDSPNCTKVNSVNAILVELQKLCSAYKKTVTGDLYPFSERKIRSNYFVFALTSLPQREAVYYIRVHSTSSLNLPVTLWQTSRLEEKDNSEFGLLAIFYGIFLAILLYNFCIYVMTRQSIHLVYCLATASYAIVSLGVNGYGSRYIWPNSNFLRQELLCVAIPVMCAAQFWFMRVYLFDRFWAHKSRGALIVTLSFLILALLGALSRLIFNYGMAMRTIIIFTIMPTALLIAYFGIVESMRRRRIAYIYLAGFSAFMIGSVLVALKSLGKLPPNFIFSWSQQIGSAIEMILFSLGIGYRYNLMKREKEQAEIHSLHEKLLMLESVSRFVPRQFIKILGKENVSYLSLGDSRQVEMTVLFSDIRGFTRLSESMSADDTFRFVNSYLKRMGPIIQKNRGFIDKFIGDAIMALFADTTENAIQASLSMRRELDSYNEHRASVGYPPIDIGIGLNTGTLMLGTVGSAERLDTTVIGDAVNLSARVENLTKTYGVSTLITDSVFRSLKNADAYCLREIDSVVVKGKTKPVVLYELFDSDEPVVRDQKKALLPFFATALIHYKTGDFRDALETFRKCSVICPSDPASQLYIRRCEKLVEKPPGPGWRGVVKLK